MRRSFFLSVIGVMVALLASCGSNSSSSPHSSSAPIFTSTPVTVAEQSVAYSYQVAATDPSGGTVTFSLTTAPSGAALSGSTVSWTPTAAQSRVPNNFTVTATSSGGSATQSWTVTPNGTITVNWVDTYWSPSGPVQVPQPASAALSIQALVPQADGSITLLNGSATSTPGVFTVANVPAGNYWLAAGGGGAFWTSSATFDAGQDIAIGQPPFASTTNTTTLAFDVSGMASDSTEEYVEFFTDPLSGFTLLGAPPGSTSVSATLTAEGYLDWSQIHDGFLMQYELTPLGSLNNYVLGPELELPNLTLTDGATNPISGTLNSATETSLDLSVSGSQWASAFNNAGPASATVQD